MPYALSPLPVMNIASSFLFHAACKFTAHGVISLWKSAFG